jgi:hypothetical protein
MTTREVRRAALGVGVAIISSVFSGTDSRGDGGALRAWERQGGIEIAVFTDPTPFVPGPVDISVLLLDAETGEPIPEARATIEVTPEGRPGGATKHLATSDAATNKLLRAAVFELLDSGRCEVKVTVDSPSHHARVRFELDVPSPSTTLPDVFAWIFFPFPVVVLYGVHRGLVGRKSRSGGPARTDRPPS